MSVIDDYLKDIPPAQREALERIRSVAKQVAPDAVDTIGYGIPVLRFKDKYLIGLAAFKHHVSIFPGAEAVKVFGKELSGFKTSKGTIQFTPDRPIPDRLLKDIVQLCADHIEQRRI